MAQTTYVLVGRPHPRVRPNTLRASSMGEQPAKAENPPCQHGDFSRAQAGGEVGGEAGWSPAWARGLRESWMAQCKCQGSWNPFSLAQGKGRSQPHTVLGWRLLRALTAQGDRPFLGQRSLVHHFLPESFGFFLVGHEGFQKCREIDEQVSQVQCLPRAFSMQKACFAVPLDPPGENKAF